MFIDLILCEHVDPAVNHGKLYLFQAPAFSRLTKGDRVICKTQFGEADSIVRAACTVEVDSPVYDCILMAAKATMPLQKVLSKVFYYEFSYDGTDT